MIYDIKKYYTIISSLKYYTSFFATNNDFTSLNSPKFDQFLPFFFFSLDFHYHDRGGLRRW